MTDERYDVVIIGGGPAGTRTASAVSGRGLSTLLLEKRMEIGLPVRCAEGVGPADAVERLIEPDEDWISCRVDGISIVSPDGRRYDKMVKGGGYILDRHRFDDALARRAVKNGTEIRTGHQATGLSLENGIVSGVMVLDTASGRRYSVSSGLTVGADGVESLSPRWAGLRNASRPSSMFSCAQYLVEGIDLKSSFAEFHLGSRFAPGGYAWVFPKGESSANVGVGIDPMRAGGTTTEGYLERFIAFRCPAVKRGRFVAGGTLTGRPLQSLSTGGYVCVGEAANQNNPFTGGGILESLAAADIAAEVITDAFERGDISARMLSRYDSLWKRSAGRSNDRFHKAASVFYSLTDGDLDALLRALSRDRGLITGSGIDPARLMRLVLFSVPSVALRAAAAALKRRRF